MFFSWFGKVYSSFCDHSVPPFSVVSDIEIFDVLLLFDADPESGFRDTFSLPDIILFFLLAIFLEPHGASTKSESLPYLLGAKGAIGVVRV